MKIRDLFKKSISKQIQHRVMSALLMLITSQLIFAQGITVKGNVKDNQGAGLPGVSITIEGAGKGTLTDMSGNFTIAVPSTKTVLVCSFIGMETKKVVVGNQQTIMVTLNEASVSLNEVVAVGYGKVKKSDVTGSLTQITEKTLQERPVANVLQAMQGKATGVDISSNNKPGSVPSITIRGNRSLTATNTPLYVIDGIPLTAGSIEDLNTNDIASIEILKDASSTAIYGSRGANGVILVSTKKGKKGSVSVSYDGSLTVNRYKSLTDWMSAGEYIDTYRTALMNAGQYGTETFTNLDTPVKYGYPTPALDNSKFALATDPYAQESVLNGYNWTDKVGGTVAMRNTTAAEQALGWPAQVPDYNSRNMRTYDWRKSALRDGLTQNHQISISAGGENSRVYMAAGYVNQLGEQKDQDYKRYNMTLNGEITPQKWLTVGMSANASLAIQNYGIIKNSSNTGSKDLYSSATGIYPYAVPYDKDGNYIMNPGGNLNVWNPLRDIDQSINQTKNTSVMANSFAEIRFTPWLKYHMNFGVQYRESLGGQWTGSKSTSNLIQPSTAGYSTSMKLSYVLENLLYFDKTFNEIHTVNATIMQSASKSESEGSSISSTGQIYDSSSWYNIAANTLGKPTGYGTSYSANTLTSYMGRLNYTLMNKYILTATGRWDGASVLADGHKWSFFPSFAAAWKLQEESFLKNVEWLRELKLRFGYGVTGNAAVSAYTSTGPLSSNGYVFGSTAAVGYLPQQVSNPNLGWEKTGEYNLGLDFSVLNDRISGGIDVYQMKTTDLLMSKSLPAITGFVTKLQNIGETKNRGIEVSISTVNIKTKDFSWRTSISWSTNKEEIVSLLNGKQDMLSNRWFIGQPLQVYYDYKYDRIWQNTTEDLAEMAKFKANGVNFHPGMIKVADLNSDYKIDANDQSVLGTNRPKWTGGITNTFTYKEFEMSFFVYAKVGQMYFGGYPTYPSGGANMPKYIATDSWSYTNTTAKFPMLNTAEFGAYAGIPQYAQSMAYNEGTFVAVRNISLAYSLPAKVLSKLSLKKLQFSCQVLNPFLFGGDLVKRGINPDDNTGWDTASGTGMPVGGQNNNTILSQSVVFGVRVGF